MAFLKSRNTSLGPRYNSLAAYYRQHGETWHVRWDYAFFQMAIETNFLTYRRPDGRMGDVDPRQNNFAGIGTTGGGVPGDSFPDVSTGVLAQIQHLVVYSGETIAAPVAPRTQLKQEHILKKSLELNRPVRFSDLARRWAADPKYASSIEWVAGLFRAEHCRGGTPPPPAAKEALPWAERTSAPGAPRPPSGTPTPAAASPAPNASPVRTIWSRDQNPAHPPQVAAAAPTPPNAKATADKATHAIAKQKAPTATASIAAPVAKAEPGPHRAAPTETAAPAPPEATAAQPLEAAAPLPDPPAAEVASAGPDEPAPRLAMVAPPTMLTMPAPAREAPALQPPTRDPAPANAAAQAPSDAAAAPQIQAAAAPPHEALKPAFDPAASPPSGLGVKPKTCSIDSASFGGDKAVLIRAENGRDTRYIAVPVLAGFEKPMTASFIAARAPGGEQVGEFASREAALAKARELCPTP